MALIICPDCGGNVSDKAVSCPHCGFVKNQLENVEMSKKSANTFSFLATNSKFSIVPAAISSNLVSPLNQPKNVYPNLSKTGNLILSEIVNLISSTSSSHLESNVAV